MDINAYSCTEIKVKIYRSILTSKHFIIKSVNKLIISKTHTNPQ